MAEAEAYVHWSIVVERVGRALFKDEYIPHLTWRERWLLEATRLDDMRPTMGTLFDPSGRGGKPPSPFRDLPELPAARARQAFMDWQRKQIADWSDRHALTVHERDDYDEVEQHAFEAAFLKSFPPHGVDEPAGVETARRPASAGRPREWDWDGAYVEIIRIAQTPDGLPEVQARVVERVAAWFIEKQGDHPADSKIKARVSAIYQALGRGPK